VRTAESNPDCSTMKRREIRQAGQTPHLAGWVSRDRGSASTLGSETCPSTRTHTHGQIDEAELDHAALLR
jgi:hypothetical protein